MGRRKKSSRKHSSVIGKNVRKNQQSDKSNSNETEVIMKREIDPSVIEIPIIDVYSRLKLPLVHSSMHHRSSEDSDEEDTLELNFSPRFMFVSNLCPICMERSEEICEFCGMVSYCTEKHKKQDLPKHRNLCKVLTDVCSIRGGLSLLREFSPDDYRIYRLRLIEIVERSIGRSLELWEKEIILYPRVCRSCHYFSKDLKCCEVCGVELFCDDNHRNGHEEWCREFQVFKRMLFMQHQNGHVNPYIPDSIQKSALRLSDNFDFLMARIYDRSIYYCNMDCYTYCSLSHISTIPLTTLYSMQISYENWELIDTLVVHMIGAEFQFECINLHVWEKLFLHFLPNLKYLRLMFIGPELRLPMVPVELLANVKLCLACKSSKRLVNVSFYPEKFYHDFCHSKQFVKPHLVCLFNPGLYRTTGFAGRDTWPETIREVCKIKIPVCITSYTKHEIPQDMIRIKAIANITTILESQRNPFASIKPDRNFVSDDTAPLIYKNYYVAIVKGN